MSYGFEVSFFDHAGGFSRVVVETSSSDLEDILNAARKYFAAYPEAERPRKIAVIRDWQHLPDLIDCEL